MPISHLQPCAGTHPEAALQRAELVRHVDDAEQIAACFIRWILCRSLYRDGHRHGARPGGKMVPPLDDGLTGLQIGLGDAGQRDRCGRVVLAGCDHVAVGFQQTHDDPATRAIHNCLGQAPSGIDYQYIGVDLDRIARVNDTTCYCINHRHKADTHCYTFSPDSPVQPVVHSRQAVFACHYFFKSTVKL